MKPNKFTRINTIELDELLNGEPTWEQVAQFFQHGEFHEEHYTVQAIKKHLRTEQDKITMQDFDFSIEDMLNGRIGGEGWDKAEEIFKKWNEKLGFKCFNWL